MQSKKTVYIEGDFRKSDDDSYYLGKVKLLADQVGELLINKKWVLFMVKRENNTYVVECEVPLDNQLEKTRGRVLLRSLIAPKVPGANVDVINYFSTPPRPVKKNEYEAVQYAYFATHSLGWDEEVAIKYSTFHHRCDPKLLRKHLQNIEPMRSEKSESIRTRVRTTKRRSKTGALNVHV